MTVTPLQKPFSADDIPATLRVIADEIEAGKHGLKTTCVVVLGHTEHRPMEGGARLHRDQFSVFGCGPRVDVFTVRGLLLTAATQKIEDDDPEAETSP